MMRKQKKILLLLSGIAGLVVLLLIALHFSVPKLINSENMKEKVSEYFHEKTGGTISFLNASIHLFPNPHITINDIHLSIPEKVEGTVTHIKIYPEIIPLLWGDVRLAQLNVNSPNIMISPSKDKEPFSLEEIEQDIQSLLETLSSVAPELLTDIENGKLVFWKGDKKLVSFNVIQSQIEGTSKGFDVSVTCSSDIWDSLELHVLIGSEKLTSEGKLKVKQLQTHQLMGLLPYGADKYIGKSLADITVNFQGVGLQQIKADVESALPELVFIRGKKHLDMRDIKFKGNAEIEPKKLSVALSTLDIGEPSLQISGNYTLNRTSNLMEIDVQMKSIDMEPTRKHALDIGGDITVIRDVFEIVQSGHVPILRLHASGNSADDLGRLENIQIEGSLNRGTIYIPGPDLGFQNVSGDVVISEGILEGKNIKAAIERNYGSKGKLRLGLKGKDAPFHLDIFVKADIGQLPMFLMDKHLLKNKAILQEINRINDIQGNAEGRLVFGERLDDIKVGIDVSSMSFVATYEPLPFPIEISGGRFSLDEERVSVKNISGSLGRSFFSKLEGSIGLADPPALEILSGQLTIATDEIYPWLTSYEQITPVLEDVPSIRGMIELSSMNLKGLLHQPKDWQFLMTGEVKDLALDAAFLPGTAEKMNGMFTITHEELSLRNIRTKMIDSSLTVSGSFRNFPDDIHTVDLAIRGDIGQEVASWITDLIKLPEELKMNTPFAVSDGNLLWEKNVKTSFDGNFTFNKETNISLAMTKTPDELSVQEVTIQDRTSNVAAEFTHNKSMLDLTYKGTLTADTIHTILMDSTFSDAFLEGDFRTQVFFEDINRSTIEGTLHGKNVVIPWNSTIPLVAKDIYFKGKGKSAVFEHAEFELDRQTFTVSGTISSAPSWFSVDMDLSSDGIDWKLVEEIAGSFDNKKQNQNKEKAEDIRLGENIPFRGILRIRSDFFQYYQFKWEPFHVDVSFDGDTAHIKTINASLCSISTDGNISVSDRGIELDIKLEAKGLDVQPTVLCITEKDVDATGIFDLDAHIQGSGKLDTITASLNGPFHISAKNGKIYKSRSLDRTLDLLNKTETFEEKLPDLDKEIISYNDMIMQGTLQDYKVVVDEGILNAALIGIIAHGQFDLQEQTLDFNALVAPLKNVHWLVSKIPILGHILGGNLVSVPVKIQGNIKDPQVTFLSPSAVGSEFIGIIERTIKLPITIIEPVLPEAREK